MDFIKRTGTGINESKIASVFLQGERVSLGRVVSVTKEPLNLWGASGSNHLPNVIQHLHVSPVQLVKRFRLVCHWHDTHFYLLMAVSQIPLRPLNSSTAHFHTVLQPDRNGLGAFKCLLSPLHHCATAVTWWKSALEAALLDPPLATRATHLCQVEFFQLCHFILESMEQWVSDLYLVHLNTF